MTQIFITAERNSNIADVILTHRWQDFLHLHFPMHSRYTVWRVHHKISYKVTFQLVSAYSNLLVHHKISWTITFRQILSLRLCAFTIKYLTTPLFNNFLPTLTSQFTTRHLESSFTDRFFLYTYLTPQYILTITLLNLPIGRCCTLATRNLEAPLPET